MELRITSNVVVEPIIHGYLDLEKGEELSYAASRRGSEGIVPHVAGIRQTIGIIKSLTKEVQHGFSAEADMLSVLHIRAVSFDNTCKLLFLMVADSRQDTENMFEESDHSIWRDSTADRSLANKMARYYDLCLESLQRCRDDLNKILKGLLQLEEKRQAVRRSRRCWQNPKLPVSGATQDIPKLLHEDLRNHIDLFSTLVRQAVSSQCGRKAGSSSTRDLGHAKYPRVLFIEDYHPGSVRQVLRLLYDTISSAWTCRDHVSHGMHICLNFLDMKASGANSCKGVSFNLVVKITPFEGAAERKSLELRTKATYYASSRFDAGTATYQAARQTATTQKCRDSMPSTLRDLSLEKDLCLCLRESCAALTPSKQSEDTCLGFLMTSSGFCFVFFYVSQKQTSHSLEDVLSAKSNKAYVPSVKGRLRLAMFIGAGFLYLGASSWLPEGWSSKDVYFFIVEESSEVTSSYDVFLQSRLSSSRTRPPASDVDKSNVIRSGLLSLGVILIEVAFSAPWGALQLQKQTMKTLPEPQKNYINLMRLSETVSRELGSRYAKVVRTCLSEGFDVQDPRHREADLEEVISEDVVRELSKCLLAVSDDLGTSSNCSLATQY